MSDPLTEPDPASDTYFDGLVATIEAETGLSPAWREQWLALARGAATLRKIITADLNTIRGAVATIETDIAALQTDAGRWAYGSSEIAANAQTVSVAHGLAGTPAVVIVSPTCALAGADLWHETPDAIQFTVATSVAAAAPVTFDWLAALAA